MAITLINDDAKNHGGRFDLILTDPPYEMSGDALSGIINNYDAQHLVLITTMRQFLQFHDAAKQHWAFSFDFVFDGVAPKQSKNIRQPHYTHQTGVYLIRKGAKSAFNRKRRQRSDVYENNGYWQTIIHAPRGGGDYAKNQTAITDTLGSFDIQSVVDPFAGSGTTLLAATELELDACGIEKDKETFEIMKSNLKFVGAQFN